MKVKPGISIRDFAILVARALEINGIDVILTGGAVVSIYSKNRYQSKDLDFLSPSDHKKIEEIMKTLGFKQRGKDFYHPDSEFFVEFPGRTLMIGDSVQKPEGKIKSGKFTLKLLSPTQSVMDRLAAFYHWNDRQSLEQALLVAKAQPIKLDIIKKWSIAEGMADRYQTFHEALSASRKS